MVTPVFAFDIGNVLLNTAGNGGRALGARLLPGAADSVNAAMRRGDVYIISCDDGDPVVQAILVDALWKAGILNQFLPGNVLFVKTNAEKACVACKSSVTLMIDDSPEVIAECAKAGVQTLHFGAAACPDHVHLMGQIASHHP